MVFCVAILTCCLGISSAQQSSEVTGKWNMVSLTPDGDQVNWTLSITRADGKYSAAVDGSDGVSAAKDVKVDGTNIHLRTSYQDEDYDIDLKLEGDKLTGTWSGNGDSGETKGTRAAAASATK